MPSVVVFIGLQRKGLDSPNRAKKDGPTAHPVTPASLENTACLV